MSDLKNCINDHHIKEYPYLDNFGPDVFCHGIIGWHSIRQAGRK